MTNKLKVYGWTGFYPAGFADRPKNCRFFMAAPSKAAVYRATGKSGKRSEYEVSETGNDQEIATALARPGTVFFWDEHNFVPRDHVAVEVEPKEAR